MSSHSTNVAGQAAEMAGGAEHAAAEHASGMPQLDFSTYPNLIFWMVVTLVVVYFVLTRFALPRIASVLSERQDTITGDLARAEELKRKAEEAEQEYQKALADARAEAQRIVAETRAEMQAKLEEAMRKADAEIAARAAESERRIAEIRAGAMASIKEVATDTAKEILHVLGAKADARKIAAAVAAHLKG